ncbi:orotate phosphoribosyltransferase [Acuticoccus sp. I52.16.1]|uniref:orotate phosphoribosyltransferase n=1 Tax=Acuticoccus sp. I52.16.1 TaxID=2928472 RepID=UPI001FD31F49|nr:orotate phosphoribosyltransferase [Acuticoccus sp. I52.16.1]UOM35979.1 orotate phosphoribosyltransferase [Acuticoccus sp. I52.16.1]
MTAATILPREDVARITARALLEVQAVHLRPEEPFTYTSGLKSPVYVDCRKLIAYPRLRATLMQLAVGSLARDVGLERFDAVAGGETAGIPFAAWIADLMALPMQYVRKAPKGFGRNAQIEGAFREGQRTLLVEDLATDGGSKVRFAEALRGAGAEVAHCFVVFHHDIFPGSSDALGRHGMTLHALARWSDVMRVAADDRSLDRGALAEVEKFLRSPLAWSAAHGGVDRLDV